MHMDVISEMATIEVNADQMSVADAGQASFRFLDLPLEIREQIYRELLTCHDLAKEPRIETNVKALELISRWKTPAYEDIFIDHGVSLAILLTNREVYHEAFEVMLRANTFVRVVAERGNLYRWMHLFSVPILAKGQVSRQFQAPALQLTYKGETECDLRTCHVYLVPSSCLARIADVLSVMCLPEHDDVPKAKAIELVLLAGGDKYLNKAKQRQTVLPFKLYLCGLRNMEISGAWDPEVVNNARVAWNRDAGWPAEEQPTYLDSLERVQGLIKLVKIHQRRGEVLTAGRYLRSSSTRVRCNGRLCAPCPFPRCDLLGPYGDRAGDLKRRADLIFSINTGIGSLLWDIAQMSTGDPSVFREAIRVMRSFDRFSQSGPDFDCYPSPAEISRVHDRWTKAAQLMADLGLDETSSNLQPPWS